MTDQTSSPPPHLEAGDLLGLTPLEPNQRTPMHPIPEPLNLSQLKCALLAAAAECPHSVIRLYRSESVTLEQEFFIGVKDLFSGARVCVRAVSSGTDPQRCPFLELCARWQTPDPLGERGSFGWL